MIEEKTTHLKKLKRNNFLLIRNKNDLKKNTANILIFKFSKLYKLSHYVNIVIIKFKYIFNCYYTISICNLVAIM